MTVFQNEPENFLRSAVSDAPLLELDEKRRFNRKRGPPGVGISHLKKRFAEAGSPEKRELIDVKAHDKECA